MESEKQDSEQSESMSPCSIGSDKSAEDSPRPVVRMPSAKPISTKTHSLSTLLQRAQASKVAGRGPKIGNQSDSNPKIRPLRQAGGDNP